MRDEPIRILREKIEIDVKETTKGSVEYFQNRTLRPILKFQNKLYLSYFRDYLSTIKFDLLQEDQKAIKSIVELSLSKDQKLKEGLIGIAVGLMTEEEFVFFTKHKKELRKRIISMLSKRIYNGLVD